MYRIQANKTHIFFLASFAETQETVVIYYEFICHRQKEAFPQFMLSRGRTLHFKHQEGGVPPVIIDIVLIPKPYRLFFALGSTAVYELMMNPQEESGDLALEERKLSFLQVDLTFTSFSWRYSTSQKSILLYIGDSKGQCHIFHTQSGMILATFQLFKPSVLSQLNRPKYYQVTQMLHV